MGSFSTLLLDVTGDMLLKRGGNYKNMRPLPKRSGKMGRFNRRQYVPSGISFPKAFLLRNLMALNSHSGNIPGDWPSVCPTKG